MTRAQLEHLIRASGAIAASDSVVIIGSQAILALHPDAPAELLGSMEADLYPLDDPRKADIIDGAIGEESPFHEEFGYYAHGIGPETAILPAGWRSRAVTVKNENTRQVAGICLHPIDLAVSKLAAGRPKDLSFVTALIRHGFVSKAAIAEAAGELPPEHQPRVSDRLSAAGI